MGNARHACCSEGRRRSGAADVRESRVTTFSFQGHLEESARELS